MPSGGGGGGTPKSGGGGGVSSDTPQGAGAARLYLGRVQGAGGRNCGVPGGGGTALSLSAPELGGMAEGAFAENV
jgi:hypothetical protein